MDFGLMNETSENNHNNFKFFFHLCPLSFLIENSYHRKYHKIFLKSFPPVSLYDIAGNNHTKYIQAKTASFLPGCGRSLRYAIIHIYSRSFVLPDFEKLREYLSTYQGG